MLNFIVKASLCSSALTSLLDGKLQAMKHVITVYLFISSSFHIISFVDWTSMKLLVPFDNIEYEIFIFSLF